MTTNYQSLRICQSSRSQSEPCHPPGRGSNAPQLAVPAVPAGAGRVLELQGAESSIRCKAQGWQRGGTGLGPIGEKSQRPGLASRRRPKQEQTPAFKLLNQTAMFGFLGDKARVWPSLSKRYLPKCRFNRKYLDLRLLLLTACSTMFRYPLLLWMQTST